MGAVQPVVRRSERRTGRSWRSRPHEETRVSHRPQATAWPDAERGHNKLLSRERVRHRTGLLSLALHRSRSSRSLTCLVLAEVLLVGTRTMMIGWSPDSSASQVGTRLLPPFWLIVRQVASAATGRRRGDEPWQLANSTRKHDDRRSASSIIVGNGGHAERSEMTVDR